MRNKPSKKDVLDEDGLWPGPCSCAGRTPRQGERTSRLAHGMSLLEDFFMAGSKSERRSWHGHSFLQLGVVQRKCVWWGDPPEIREESLLLARLLFIGLNVKLQVSHVCFCIPVMISYFYPFDLPCEWFIFPYLAKEGVKRIPHRKEGVDLEEAPMVQSSLLDSVILWWSVVVALQSSYSWATFFYSVVF